jgi:hypothetical protein
MLNAKETYYVLVRHFNDCYKYWLRQGNGYKNRHEAFKLALEDIKCMKYDPFTPCGDELDPEAHANFIKYREMDLGI